MTENSEEVLADPVGMIVWLVSNVEKHLDADHVRDIVCNLVPSRAGRRNLAQALHDNPSLLRTGKPPAPFRVAKLLMALREAGARDTALPHCGECGRPAPTSAAARADAGDAHPASTSPPSARGATEPTPWT